MSQLILRNAGRLSLLAALSLPGVTSAWSGMQPGDWRHESTASDCRLVHSVPGFGDAVFERTAQSQTRLRLEGYTGARSRTTGTLFALPPAWRHDHPAESLGRLWREPGKQPFQVTPDVTHRALTKLQHGMAIAVRFRDPDDALATRFIGMTPIASSAAIDAFQQCLATLPALPQPVTEQIQIYFPSGQIALDAEAKQLLDDAVNRVRYWPDLSGIEVIGHADAAGPALQNDELSRRRMLLAVDYLITRGVPPQFITSGYRGEADAPGATVWRHNRRVAVRFLRGDS